MSYGNLFLTCLVLGFAGVGLLGCGQSAKVTTVNAKSGPANEELLIPGGALPLENREAYDPIEENAFFQTLSQPQSTFAIDVDTASYSNVRRLIRNGVRPPKGAVRLEELVNYFPYEYKEPQGDSPF